MRLRLTVQRNGLPTTNILWNVPETNSNSAYTITRLLEDVNHILPLEAEQWGLDDYAVEVDGFECLHFSPVVQALKENDHVSIRPLVTAEIRARTLAGRLQISEGGQHLVDGVPFGRPYLRTPHRPAVRIPPRKRRLSDDQEEVVLQEAQDSWHTFSAELDEPVRQIENSSTRSTAQVPPRKRLRLQNEEAGDSQIFCNDLETASATSDKESLHNTFRHAHPIGGSASPGHVTQTRISKRESRVQSQRIPPSSPAAGLPRHAPSKTVQFKRPVAEELGDGTEDDDEDDEDDEDFTSCDIDSDSEASSSTSHTTSSGSESDSDSPSDSDSNSDSDSDSNSDSDSDSGSDATSPPDILSSKGDLQQKTNPTKPSSPKLVPPGNGRSATRLRNSRRTRTNRLRHLKEAGKLHKDATLADLQKYEETNSCNSGSILTPAHSFSSASGKRKVLDSEDTTRGITGPVASELEKWKQDLMAKIDHSSSDTSKVDKLVPPVGEVSQAFTTEISIKDHSNKKEVSTRRMRPDTSAISRIIARQAIQPVTKKAKTKPVDEGPPEPEGASQPDFWKSRINLSAFECWEEQYELSAPPFPFQQHWDPASKLMRDKKHKKKISKPTPPIEELSSHDDEEKILLNYDDFPTENSPEAETSAAIEDQLRQDVATAAHGADPPPLPEDVTALPSLTSTDIKQGAIIVCKFFAVNPVTITPEISDYKTAVVEKEGDSGNGAGTIQLKIAARDLPRREKKFGKNGKRIYDVGDAFLMEDEQEEDGLWEGQFSELLEAKLLQAAA